MVVKACHDRLPANWSWPGLYTTLLLATARLISRASYRGHHIEDIGQSHARQRPPFWQTPSAHHCFVVAPLRPKQATQIAQHHGLQTADRGRGGVIVNATVRRGGGLLARRCWCWLRALHPEGGRCMIRKGVPSHGELDAITYGESDAITYMVIDMRLQGAPIAIARCTDCHCKVYQLPLQGVPIAIAC